MAPDLADIALEIRVESADPDDLVQQMLDAWETRCPIYLAIRKPNAVVFSATHGTN